MQLPLDLLSSLKGIKGFDKEAFEKIHESGEQVTSIRINPRKKSKIPNLKSKIPWTELGYYLETRPSFTFDPLFHAGCYYVQEASSMFLEQALKQTIDLSRSLKILDLSAAPGGKSTHILSLISKESLLVSNEVIRSRANILKDNIIKWGGENAVVTNNDPSDFQNLENYFDVIIVDAPCSGSGLFRRDEEAIEEWSLNNVQLCSQRQQRILADAWPALKKDGVLIYSTCSYSKEEDEDILDWLNSFSISNCQLAIEDRWGIEETRSTSGAYGYRFWPYKLKGEGFFIACFKKTAGDEQFDHRSKKKLDKIPKKEEVILRDWVDAGDKEFLKFGSTVHALPVSIIEDVDILSQNLRAIYSGTAIGEIMKDRLVPAHALAVSNILGERVERTELNYEQAIRYLQRKDLDIGNVEKGWRVVEYKGCELGWINVLSNRINNYYPKELRILKDI